VNIVIFRRQLRRATRQLWLFSGLAVVDVLLVLVDAAAGQGASAVPLAVIGIILLVLAALVVPYRRRLKRAIAQAEAIGPS
jgi:Flp pilus assembly protein TadB